MLTEAQHIIRARGVGSSEIAAIAGVNPWKTAHDVYLEKRGLVERQPTTLRQRIGQIAEHLIADLYVEETGANIESKAQADARGTLTHPAHPWIVATPDRLVLDAPRVVEIKWVGWRLAGAWGADEDGIPDYVRTQAEWLMATTGCDECDVPAILGGEEFRIYRVRRNVALFERLRAIGERFWFEHVLPGAPPPVDGSENATAMLRALYRRGDGEWLKAPPEAREWVDRKLAADKAAESAETDARLAANKLREMVGDAEGMLGDGFKVSWKANKRGVRTLLVKVKEG